MLVGEYGTASNIKSRVNRLSVLGAITSTQQKLKLYAQSLRLMPRFTKVPPNGLVIYCGTCLNEEGKEKKKSDVTFSFQEQHNTKTLERALGHVKTEEKKEEPESFEVENGSRITPTQWDVMSVPPQRFSLVVKDPRMKLLIAVVKDEEGGPVYYVSLKGDDGLSEVECPQPFVYHIPPKPAEN